MKAYRPSQILSIPGRGDVAVVTIDPLHDLPKKGELVYIQGYHQGIARVRRCEVSIDGFGERHEHVGLVISPEKIIPA